MQRASRLMMIAVPATSLAFNMPVVAAQSVKPVRLARANPGTSHSVEVRLADRLGKTGLDYNVLARRGYYE